ncbi:MAG: hypothetical protein HN737_12505 [Desulfobacterales bacterium]|jgi:hypothetical protein|nr:hypothetical protein [Desulfobacteraceae bacterium]MBT4363326.1 hypothetical protein [Desulfobacteraceae bacterium]MBT7084654.1 hypothetical protein [Desulfobacterales bacterium]MBT7698217.1 hypothetical protein [Desulfobacterales bacterium]
MTSHNNTPTMNRKIFELDLNTETISAYLLCCGVSDAGQKITTNNLLEKWNSSEESLHNCLKELEDRNILKKIISDREGNDAYNVNNEENWDL